MKKIIELFKWDYEGEYQQYFYVIEEEQEKSFLQEILKYLNIVHSKTDFPWADCLADFKDDLKINMGYSISYIDHLPITYYINFDNNKFSLSKVSYKRTEEQIKYETIRTK